MIERKLLERIEEEMNTIPIVNTHDHTVPLEKAMNEDLSYLYEILLCNSNHNLLGWLPDESCRITRETTRLESGTAVRAEKLNLTKMWKKLEPIIGYARSSPHHRMFMYACRKLFNLDYEQIDDEKKWKDLSIKIAKSNKRKDWYHFVLKEKANIEVTFVVNRPTPDVEKEFFRSVMNLDDFVRGYDGAILMKLEKKYNARVETFGDYLALLDKAFKTITERGTIAIKSNQAYRRSLDYENVTKKQAEKGFQPVGHFGWADRSISPIDIKNFQDYMMHEIIRNTVKYNVPIQIHTGSPAPIPGSRPLNLLELIESHPNAGFDILHGGGPYTGEMAVMARFYPNIYINLAWMLNGYPGPTGMKRVLSEWLEIIPWNKFMWGADCVCVEETYGVALAVRKLIAEVLTEKAQNGWGEETVIKIGRGILRENAVRFYRLSSE